jgi:ribosome assembly protein 1
MLEIGTNFNQKVHIIFCSHVFQIGAGNLVGISGLDDVILKTASLSAVADAPLLAPVERNAEPIVRVCIEPRAPSQLDALRRGLRLLNQADPCVHVFEQVYIDSY